MTKTVYLSIRTTAYKQVGELGTRAELWNIPELNAAYDKACQSLDAIDALGIRLGYLDAETNEVL